MMVSLLDCAFQPIVHENGNIYAYEALMRFKGHFDRSPDQLIRYWERSGYIETMDLMMVDVICAAVKTASMKMKSQPRIAINVSVRTIEAIGNQYIAKLAPLGDLTRHLIIEITESVKISNAAAFLRFIMKCKAHGYHIALDDCAPGHPFATSEFMGVIRPAIVKIDGGFFQNCVQTGVIDMLLGLIHTAHQLPALVIIEHISNEEYRNLAFEYGADFVQGYAVGMPGQISTISNFFVAF